MGESMLFVLYSLGSILCFSLKSSFFLGLGMMWCSLMISFKVSLTKSWFGVIFFLVFISGLLVLIFYVITIDYNLSLKFSKSIFYLGISFLCLSMTSFSLEKKKFCLVKQSTKVFKTFEGGFMIFLGAVVLLVLWLVVKLIFTSRGNLRVTY